MEQRLIAVFLLTAFINLINALTRASRLAGVRAGRLATAISLFSVVYLAASMANTLQAPLLASTVEAAIKSVKADPSLVYGEAIRSALDLKLRFVILGATAGTVLGSLMIPSFVASFANAVKAFGEAGSVFRLVPRLLFSLFTPEKRILVLRGTDLAGLKRVALMKMSVPAAFLFWNLFSYSLWTVNVLAGLYAGALYPEYRQTAVLMASFVGNAAIVINVMMVDPVLAKATDDVARGEKDEEGLKQIVFYLALTYILGTFLSQVLLHPVAEALKWLTQWLKPVAS
ncbi:MAG: lipid II flippase Amj family protein [Firmicutes bacterium]|nr:lipid II flippase Amj family protein [Bacillota bacterium]